MFYGLNIALILALGWIAYQDFRSRMIYWWLPVLVFGLGAGLSLGQAAAADVAKFTFQNACFVLFLLSALLLYVFLKYKTVKGFTSRSFGWGDILMLFALCPFFNALNFIYFMCIANLVMLVAEIIKRIIWRQKQHSIAFAGYLSLFMATLSIVHFFRPDVNFLSDFTGYFLFSTL